MQKSISIQTGHREFDEFIPRILSFLRKDVLDLVIDGRRIRGYRTPDARSIWIRDYSDMLRAVKYFEPDLKSTIDHFAETQAANGRLFDYFTTFPEKLPCERENWTKYVRVPVEADVEYRFVKALFLAWQATGDDGWMERLIPAAERALQYILNHPWRWDAQTGLVKRAYTIDTWDFAYTAGQHDWLQFRIDGNTFWGFSHADNSGYVEAFHLIARLYDAVGNPIPAGLWRKRAADLKSRMNRVCWNGRFYTHFVKRTPVTIPGVDESEQLSLSNPMAINRGITSHTMAVSILEEYLRRRETTKSFAEWFSIDPPFPDGIFGDEKLVGGAYVNGGIMPLVGGELARAAFEHGYESYGVDILKRYNAMVSQEEKTYLWYFPDGTPASVETSTSPDAMPTDGWGSSAMLYAFVEGLAGIEDRASRFRAVRLSPRWIAAGVTEAEVTLGYAASRAAFGYTCRYDTDQIALILRSPGSEVECHVLLPKDRLPETVLSGETDIIFKTSQVEKSLYVDFSTAVQDERSIQIHMKAN